MCVCSGEGIPCIPARPGGLWLPRSFLPSQRRGGCSLLWSDGGSWGFPPSFWLLDKHTPADYPVPPSLGACGCRLACPQGGAHERQLLFSIITSFEIPWGVQRSHPSQGSCARTELAPACAPLPGIAILSHLWSFQIYIYVFVSFQENWGQTYFIL